jgi:hypothetical protein
MSRAFFQIDREKVSSPFEQWSPNPSERKKEEENFRREADRIASDLETDRASWRRNRRDRDLELGSLYSVPSIKTRIPDAYGRKIPKKTKVDDDDDVFGRTRKRAKTQTLDSRGRGGP